MTTIALAPTGSPAPAFLQRLVASYRRVFDGIEEARAMAQRYQTLSQMTDAQLAARGLKREHPAGRARLRAAPNGRIATSAPVVAR